MKKLFMSTLILATSIFFTGCGGEKEISKKEETITLRLADNHAEDYPTVMGDKYFAKLVEERTEGRVKIDVYASGQLGEEKVTIEQTQFGAIDLVRVSISPLTSYNESLNALMLPYLYSSKEQMFRVLDGEIGEKSLKALEANDLIGLCWFDSGARNFYNTERPITSVKDLKGLKIRVQDSAVMMGLVESLGASATPMSFGEVYSALQTGVIDGAENNWPSYDSTSHYNVAKYFVEDEHTRVPEMILINKNSLAKLSENDQKILRKAAKEAALKQREFWQEREEVSKKKIIAAGNVITTLTVEEKKEFQDKVKSMYVKFAKNDMDTVNAILNTK